MLILLDIDGVLVRANSWKKPEFMDDGFSAFDPRSVAAFQHILSVTNADIMLTTSHKSAYNELQWCKMFALRGINTKSVRKLTSDSLQTSRKDEILNWYRTQHQQGEPFVIIDDDKALNSLPSQIKENLVLTSPSVGLTNELADEAIGILKKSEIYKPAV
jgi:hypothetical protein